MDPTQETVQAMEAMKSLKAHFVRRDGIGTDLPMFVLLLLDGVELCSFLIRDMDERDVLLSRALALTEADQVVLAVDAYGLFSPDGDPDSPISLRQRFGAGDPDVSEVLVVSSVMRDGPASVALAPYRYEGREVVWTDVPFDGEPDPTIEGQIMVALLTGWAAQGHRPSPAWSGRDLASYLGVEIWSPSFQRPPRNVPCPCGSGTKSKYCCWGD